MIVRGWLVLFVKLVANKETTSTAHAQATFLVGHTHEYTNKQTNKHVQFEQKRKANTMTVKGTQTHQTTATAHNAVFVQYVPYTQ